MLINDDVSLIFRLTLPPLFNLFEWKFLKSIEFYILILRQISAVVIWLYIQLIFGTRKVLGEEKIVDLFLWKLISKKWQVNESNLSLGESIMLPSQNMDINWTKSLEGGRIYSEFVPNSSCNRINTKNRLANKERLWKCAQKTSSLLSLREKCKLS